MVESLSRSDFVVAVSRGTSGGAADASSSDFSGNSFSAGVSRQVSSSGSEASEAEETSESLVILRLPSSSEKPIDGICDSKNGLRSDFFGHMTRTELNADTRRLLFSCAMELRGFGSLSKSCCQATIRS